MASRHVVGLVVACRKALLPKTVGFEETLARQAECSWRRGIRRESTCSSLQALLQRYLDGSVMAPHEKQTVQQEMLKNDLRMDPSDVATVLNRMEGHDNLGLKPIFRRLETELQHLWGDGAGEAAMISRAMLSPDHDECRRRNLTNMETITIDDASTTEIDDGLSATLLNPDTILVHIHIADPTRWIPNPDLPLASIARARSQTVYLPHRKFPMFPGLFGVDMCSLRPGVDTPALTMSCKLRTTDGSIVENSVDITTSTVCSNNRLSYDDVDQQLDQKCSAGSKDDVISLLHAAAVSRACKRKNDGAFELHPTREVSISASLESCGFDISIIHRNKSKSRSLVSEMMILAGEIFSKLGSQLGLPLPYRGQEIPVLPSDEELIQYPEGACRNYYRRRYMLKSLVNAYGPQKHASLALDQYVQATSPIRRYIDMLAHWQMKSALRGDSPLYTSDELQNSIDDILRTQKTLNGLQRKIEDTWLCAYFLDHKKEKFDAIVLKWLNQEHSLAIIYIYAVGKEVVATLHDPAIAGDTVTVYCRHSDPWTQTLSFSSSPDH